MFPSRHCWTPPLLLRRVDFSPGSRQHLPGAGPQQLDAARGATPLVLHKETLPMDEGQLFRKATSDYRLACGCSDPWMYLSHTCSLVPWQNKSPSSPANLSRAEVMLLFLGHLPSPAGDASAVPPGPALLLAVGKLPPEWPP